MRTTLVLAILLCICGCSSVGADAIKKAHQIVSCRAQIAKINRELQDLTQVFLYAGRMRDDDVGKLALDAALEIVGQPEDCEKALAMALTHSDVRKRSCRAADLLRERKRYVGKMDGDCSGLCVSVSELHAAQRSVSIVSRLMFFLATIAFFTVIFFRRR